MLPFILLCSCDFSIGKKRVATNGRSRCLSRLIVWADRAEQRASYIVDGEALFDLIDSPSGLMVGVDNLQSCTLGVRRYKGRRMAIQVQGGCKFNKEKFSFEV